MPPHNSHTHCQVAQADPRINNFINTRRTTARKLDSENTFRETRFKTLQPRHCKRFIPQRLH